MLHFLLLGTTVLSIAFPAEPAAGRHWQVAVDGTGDASTIQAAIDSAAVGDTVMVACGRYLEHDIEMRPGIALCSETGRADCVVIDAQGRGRCISCVDLDAETSIRGFTFTGGVAEGIDADCNGGGMYCRNSSHQVSHCAFLENRAGCYGGGVFCHESSPVLTECVFRGNTDGHGTRGIHCDRSSAPLMKGCKFRGIDKERGNRPSRKHRGHHHGH